MAKRHAPSKLDIAAATPSYQANVDITKLNIAALIQRDELISDLNLHLTLNGTGIDPADLQSDAKIQILPSRFGDIALNPSDIHVIAKGQRIDVPQFHLDTSVAQMNVEGLLDLAGDSDLRYDLQVQLPDLKQLLGTDALEGTAHLRGQASGAWPDLTTQGTLDAQRLRYDTTQLRSLAVRYEASQLGDQPHVTAEMQLQDAQLDALPVAQLDLKAIYDQATSQLRFTTEVVQSADYDGTLEGAVSLTDTGQTILLDTLRIRLQDRTWHAPQPLDVALGADGVNIRRVQLIHEDESITASGRLEGSTFDDFRLTAKNIDLDFLRTILALPELVSGQASLETALSGTMETPQLKTALHIAAPDRPSLPFEDIRATVDYAQQQLKGLIHVRQQTRDVIDLNLDLPVNIAFSDLSPANLLVDAPAAINLKINQPDLKALQRALPTLPPLAGTLQGGIDLQGTYAQLKLNSTINLQRLSLIGTIENVNAPLTLTGTIDTAPSVEALAQRLTDGALSPTVRDLTLQSASIKGQLPSSGQAPQPLRVDNLSLRADAHLPADRGPDITLHNLSLQAQALDLPATQLKLAAAMTDQRLDVRHLAIQSANSEVNGKGYLGLSDPNMQFNLTIPRLRLSDFAPTLPEDLPKEIRGTLNIAGSTQAPQVAARLRYAGARIEADAAAELEKKLPTYNAKLSIRGLDVAKFAPDIKGQINTHLRLNGAGFEGDERHATVALDIDSTNFALRGLNTELRAKLQGNAVQLNTLYVNSEPVTLDAGGHVVKRSGGGSHLHLRAGGFNGIKGTIGPRSRRQRPAQGKSCRGAGRPAHRGNLTACALALRYLAWQGDQRDI